MPTIRRSTSYITSKLRLRIPLHRTARTVVAPAFHSRGKSDRLASGSPTVPDAARQNMDGLALTLPVPPSINHQYATVNGRRLLSSAGRAYKAQVSQLVWLGLSKLHHRSLLLSRLQAESLALSVTFYFTSALRRDVDGGLKIAQDALCEGLGINDNRIVETHLYKHIDKGNPRIEVYLTLASGS